MNNPTLPRPVERNAAPFDLEAMGWWLVLSDTHIPFHDVQTIELAVAIARKRKVKGVLLNGDILDQHELSRFDKSPDDPRYKDEIRDGKQFLSWLRSKLPDVRIVWKDGNHEERLYTYLMRKAPALWGLDVLNIPNLLDFPKYDIEYVTDRRVIQVGKLNVIHGHEYRPMIQTPVNPARGLFLRAKSVALCCHFHQTSEHHEPSITGKPQGAWSVGCACQLNPLYMPLSKWNLGFVMIEVNGGGDFLVENKRVLNGEVV